jgi:hypothetical protein
VGIEDVKCEGIFQGDHGGLWGIVIFYIHAKILDHGEHLGDLTKAFLTQFISILKECYHTGTHEMWVRAKAIETQGVCHTGALPFTLKKYIS